MLPAMAAWRTPDQAALRPAGDRYSPRSRLVNVEQEVTPMLIGTIAQADSVVENCLAQPKPPGSTIRPMMHAHNPTVLPHIVFVGWLGHGLRAIDISNPYDPREVGHALNPRSPGVK